MLAMPLSDRVKLTALIAGCLFGAWGVVVELHRAPCQGSKGLFGRLLSAALYALSSALGVCAVGLSAFC